MAKTPSPPPQSASAAILNAPIPTFAGGGTLDFLGMPSNTSDSSTVVTADASAQLQWQQGHNAPAYANGAQYLPVMQSWTPQDIASIQTRMINAGLLDNDFRAGVWDQPSQQAFGQVLALANNMGRPWQEAMTSYESSTPMQWDAKSGTYVKGTKGTSRTNAPVVTRFTSPDDLATTAQGVATAKLGRSFTPEELQKFISSYHSTEASTAQAASAASGAGGGSYTQTSDPSVAADVFAKQSDPNAYNGEAFLPLVQKMNDLLSGSQFQTTKPMSA